MPDATEQAIVQNSQYSVRQFSPSTWGGFIGDSLGFLWGSQTDMLPAWGSTACDVALRIMHYMQHNALWGGAVQAWIEKFLSIPYEISGGRNLTYDWQDLFFESEFGDGYDELVSKGLVDYLTLNRGWFMELVSYGEPDTPIREGAKILGINHLDALRIIFTGNREWPYLYQSEWGGGLHKMHTTRVIHIARQPSPNTLLYGMGKSALYDSLTVANSEIMLGRHENELLNDLPPPGIVIFNNVKADEVATAMEQFEYERVRDGQNIYRAPLQMSSKDPAQPASVTFVPMSTMPEGFDKDKYTRIHVNLLALNLGLDPQDVWPLESSAMGSGEQSKVLAAKTDIKGPGQMATRLTRKWNVLLPRSLEWKYKAQNVAQDKETANLAKTWIETANTVGFMSNDEKRQLVANQVPAFADVLMDEQGQVRLFDADPKERTQVIIASDTIEMDTPDASAEEVTANSEDESVMVDNPQTAKAITIIPIVRKAIDDTSNAFISEVKAIMQDAIARAVTKAGAASRLRGVIQRYGKPGFIDGLEEGGVAGSELSDDDKLTINTIALNNSHYVSDLVNEIYSEAGMSGTPETRAPLWKKTIKEFYYAGIASADANGIYEWQVGATDHCDDCARMNKQRHRMKDYMRKGIVPQASELECGGYNCLCALVRTTGKSQGSWL